MLVVAGKRLLAHRGLALALTMGLVVAVALAVSLPVYSDAVNFALLTTQLGTVPGTDGQVARRSPFAFMFRYHGALHGSLAWPAIEPVDSYLHGSASAEIDLPRELAVRYLATGNLRLFAQAGSAYADTEQPLGWVALGTISDLERHVTLVEGRFPQVAPHGPMEVLASEAMATRLGLQTGETFIAFDANEILQKGRETFLQIPVRIVGVWKATEPEDEFWFYHPTALSEVLLMPAASLRDRIGGYADKVVYTALWYLIMDGSQIRAADADALLGRILAVQQRASGLLPGISLDTSPVQALRTYQLKTAWLSILLYAFSIPIIGLVLAFVGMAAGLSVERQRNEIAVFRCRGATPVQVFSITILEGLLVGIIALGVGILAGQWLAHLIGRTRSFLDFGGESNLRLVLTTAAWQFGLGLLGLAILAQAIPAIGAARHTVVTYKQQRARMLQPPWWQRAWLDVLLLIPAGYGVYLLRRQGSVVLPVISPALAGEISSALSSAFPSDPFQNPLLLLVPALVVYSLTLLILRLWRPVMMAVAWLASHTGSVGMLLTARHLGRTHSYYGAPLTLLILTLSLSTYTASLAQTLDDHAYDKAHYTAGADMRLVERGQSTVLGAPLLLGLPGISDSASAAGSRPDRDEGPMWEFLPVEDYLKVPGVERAARAGRYSAIAHLGSSQPSGVFIAIDRAEFASVAFWRRDFAPASLGALMNKLAVTDNGVLLPRAVLAQYGLRIGDWLRVTVHASGRKAEVVVQAVGLFDLFPSWYPQEGFLIVGNLDYLFEQLGGQVPYDVWLRTDEAYDGSQIVAGLRELGFTITAAEDATQQVRRELRRPERQGLFGLLSVGFAAAAFLSVFGFLLYALFSFRRRSIELGILRAIGLSAGQMTLLLASELAFLILTVLVVGTALGTLISRLFIPYLQVGDTPAACIPPYVVTTDWWSIVHIYTLLGLLFMATLALLAAMLLRMRIFEAVKLGEVA
jgi:putative ABC transport system permease protein